MSGGACTQDATARAPSPCVNTEPTDRETDKVFMFVTRLHAIASSDTSEAIRVFARAARACTNVKKTRLSFSILEEYGWTRTEVTFCLHLLAKWSKRRLMPVEIDYLWREIEQREGIVLAAAMSNKPRRDKRVRARWVTAFDEAAFERGLILSDPGEPFLDSIDIV